MPSAGKRRTCARAAVRRTVAAARGTHAVRDGITAAEIDAARSCSCEACPGWLRRLEAGQRTQVATRKRVSSTFALVTGAGRHDLASAAPSAATGAADWRAARAERAADALIGASVPVPSRPERTGQHAGVDTVTPAPRTPAPAPTPAELAADLHASEFRYILAACGGFVPLLAALKVPRH